MTARSLAELLGGRDRWDGAACVDRWDLFDPRHDKEPDEFFATRVEYARAMCTACPILFQCHEVAQNMRPRDRAGIWAGISYDQRGIPTTEEKK